MVTVPLFFGVFFLFFRNQPASLPVLLFVIAGASLGFLRVRVEAIPETEEVRKRRLSSPGYTYPLWAVVAMWGSLLFLALYALWLNAHR
jgi:drug/metabolite transporter (DMT)-like permease